jgi:ferredoxin
LPGPPSRPAELDAQGRRRSRRLPGHAECCRAAPDLFSLDDDLLLNWKENPPEDVTYAAGACPVAAITVEDVD